MIQLRSERLSVAAAAIGLVFSIEFVVTEH